MLLCLGLEELLGGCGVADCGLVAEPEYRGQVQRVGSVGDGFVELPVDVESLQGCSEAPERFGEPYSARWPGRRRGDPVDQ